MFNSPKVKWKKVFRGIKVFGKNLYFTYSHFSNNHGGWNKRGGEAKIAKSLNVEAGINMEGGIFRKKLVHKCNKRGVEGGKNLKKSINVEGGIF